MSKTHQDLIQTQFGPRAQAYVESAVHARGEDLDALAGVLREARPSKALDMGAGGGHVAYLMASHAAAVTATDISEEMLAAISTTAASRGLGNIEAVAAPAERLPFPDGSYDMVASRYSAHHWRDIEAGLREARRVLREGGAAVFIDAYSPGTPLLDTHLQAIELLRDTSHVRNYAIGEWCAALVRAGLAPSRLRTFRLRLEFESWIRRMATPELNMAAIRALQQGAPAEVRAHFAIEPDGSFMLDVLMVEAVAA